MANTAFGPPTQQQQVASSTAYRCNDCDISCTSQRALVRHRLTLTHASNTTGEVTESYPCSFCPKAFTRAHNRTRHENEHHFGVKRQKLTHQDEPDVNIEEADIWKQTAGTLQAQTSRASRETAQATVEAGFASEQVESSLSKQTTSSASVPNCDIGKGKNHGESLVPFDSWPCVSERVGVSPLLNSSASQGLGLEGVRVYADDVLMEGVIYLDELDGADTDEYGSENDETDADTGNRDADDIGSSSSSSRQSPDGALENATDAQTPVVVRHKFNLPVRLLHERGASSRPGEGKTSTKCPMCRKILNRSSVILSGHLREHLVSLQREHRCYTCNVAFTHSKDLKFHERCANQGHCGFNFKHERPCNGHHPPTSKDILWSDTDRLRLAYALRDWEQSQLQAYMREVEEIIGVRPLSTEAHCWTVGALTHASNSSLRSAYTKATCKSAPMHLNGSKAVHMDVVRRSMLQRLRGLLPNFKSKDAKLEQKRVLEELEDALETSDPSRAREAIASNGFPMDVAFYSKLLAAAASHHDSAITKTILAGCPQTGANDALSLALCATIQQHEVGATVTLLTAARLAKESFDGTPLFAAARCGNVRIGTALLANSADIDCQVADSLRTEDPSTALSEAIRCGQVEFVCFLLDNDAVVDSIAPGSLHKALDTRGRVQSYSIVAIVQALVRHGADPTIQNDNGLCPVDIARSALTTLSQYFDAPRIPEPLVAIHLNKIIRILEQASKDSTRRKQRGQQLHPTGNGLEHVYSS